MRIISFRRYFRIASPSVSMTILLVVLGISTLRVSSFLLKPFCPSSNIGRTSRISKLHVSGDTIEDTEERQAIELGRSQLSKYFEFPLDDWQLQAGGEILLGNNVIVCAPTGSGKTVCGEMALHVAYDRDLNGVYTTPLKALSNQKYGELRQLFGADNVGLSTGDVSINRNARLTVMTTEVYRNIAWRSSGPQEDSSDTLETYRNDLKRNAVVVLDEFHYMGLPGRGGVWEECIITSPSHTQIIGLSATLPNAVQLAEWMQGVTGRKTVLVEAPGKRPVPLTYMFATREGLFPLFKNPDAGPGSSLGLLGYRGDGETTVKDSSTKNDEFDEDEDEFGTEEKLPRGLKVNPSLKRLAQRRMQRVNRMLEKQKSMQRQRGNSFDDEWDLYSGGRGRGGSWNSGKAMSNREERKEKERILKREMRKAVPSLPVLLARLKAKDLLPAIFFIFSRAGCDQAADSIRISFKGPRDPTVEVDFNDFDEDDEPKRQTKGKTSRQRGKSGRDDIIQDSQGRSFRPGNGNIDDDSFASFLDGKLSSSDSAVLGMSGSPLNSENWKFYSVAGLLTMTEVETVARRVAQFNDDNPEIAFPDGVIEQFLFGVGSHHAGMLPAHKAFVETLFRGNFMKAVFATETLAAGINMPARTTVICGMAKRDGGGSMSLLETSNLLQMAGRAGRRGMDEYGVCVMVATPFESHDVAAEILTNPIKPISSQFRPSYALAVNLIARGQGRLDVAKQLVSKSFANWEKRRIENEVTFASQQSGIGEVLTSVFEERFMTTLVDTFEALIAKRTARFDPSYLSYLANILKDKESLKKCSKEYEAVVLSLELEETTLACLETEYKESTSIDDNVLDGDFDEEMRTLELADQEEILKLVKDQEKRVNDARKKIRKHQFSSIASIANELILDDDEGLDGYALNRAFASIPREVSRRTLQGEDLSKFAKSAIIVKRKLRKLAKTNPDVDPESLLLQAEKAKEIKDTSWDDMLAITRVLYTYGCVASDGTWELKVDDGDDEEEYLENIEDKTFQVTPAGTDVGMLNFENSLWCYTAMGGTFDVIGSSSKYDEWNSAMQNFEDDYDLFDDGKNDYGLFDFLSDETPSQDPTSESKQTKDGDNIKRNKSQEEAEKLVAHLRCLSPSEIAGYVSCFATGESSSSRNSFSSMDVFRRLTPRQQRAIQLLLDSTERFKDIQRQYSIDERTCNFQFDVSNCEVISAWANGCTWSEALEMSGAAPGDLTRLIGRAMDAVRQFGNLKYHPLRKSDYYYVNEDGDDDESTMMAVVDPFSRGLHPELRKLCRVAAKAMNRYPVKDTLPFETEEQEMFDDEDDETAVVDDETSDDADADADSDANAEEDR